MARASLDNSAYYLNREASWLAFNRTVLEEARDESNPRLERLKFLSSTASNLDEFFEVRVAGLVQQIEDGYTEAGPDGLTLVEESDLVSRETHEFVDDQYRCWNEKLRPPMHDRGIRVLGLHELDLRARAFVEEYCERELDLLLTPVTVDPAHPFPRVINKALCVAFLLRRRRRSSLTYTGVVTVPRALPRLIRLPSDGTDDFIFLADLVAYHASRMYYGYDIVSSAAFRVTRNSNLYLAEEESRNLLESVRTELHNRRKGDAVRLEIEADADPEITERLRTNFGLERWQVFRVDGPVNLPRLFNVYEQTDRPDLKFKPFVARELEDAGVQVFHGLVGLKTHCKLCLLVRKDPDGVSRRYAHLGTGNYNSTTARIYTDLSLLTTDPEITGAVHDVFSFLTAYSEHPSYAPLTVSPVNLAENCLNLIARESDHA